MKSKETEGQKNHVIDMGKWRREVNKRWRKRKLQKSWGRKGPLCVICSSSLLKQGHLVHSTMIDDIVPQAQSPVPHPGGFLRSPRRKLHSHSGQPLMLLHHLHSKEVPSNVLIEPLVFQFVPGTGCHWQEPGSILFASCLQLLYILKQHLEIQIIPVLLKDTSELTLKVRTDASQLL